MPLPLLSSIAPILGGIFKKKPGGTKVGNFIRGLFGKKRSVGPVATATPPIVAAPQLAKRLTATGGDEAGTTANSGDKKIPVWMWILGAFGLLLMFGKKLFR